VKHRHLSPAVFVALAVASIVPAVLRAETIYYREPGVAAIKSVSGKVVQETGDFIEIATADGRTVSIARGQVFEIVRDATPTGGKQAGEVKDFPRASALASRSTFDDTPARRVAYHYGFKGGMAISHLRTDPQELEETGSLRGYAFGFWWGVPITNRLQVQAEALFSKKGDAESASGYTASTHLSYFELPILARFGLLPDAPVRPSFFAGPSLSFNIAARSSLEGEDGEVDVDVKDQVGAFDFGLVLGGGLDFARGGRTFGVDVRYCKGLSDVGDGANGSAHNESIAILGSLGLQ